LSQGKGFESKLLAQLREIIGAPCTTPIVAAMETFRDLSATKLAVVDSYPPDLKAIGMREKINGYGKIMRML
jgi:maleate cis-trans isomerase